MAKVASATDVKRHLTSFMGERERKRENVTAAKHNL